MYDLENYENLEPEYKKKQKRQLWTFVTSIIMSVVCAISGVAFSLTASSKATETYKTKINDASKTSDYSERIRFYEEAINIPGMGGEKDAYLGLIQAYKENDSIFDVDEAKQLEKLFTNNKAEIAKDTERYTELCFETGKLFWYYYNYGDGSDNQLTKAKSSIEWFQDVIENASENYKNLGMAKVYANVGIFYRDITTAITEADDKGKYKPLFENLSELISTVAQDDTESEIVRLELLELTRNAIQQYATKFKNDGVKEQDLLNMIETIENITNRIDTTTDVTDEKKGNIISNIEDTKSSVETAFGTSKGGK